MNAIPGWLRDERESSMQVDDRVRFCTGFVGTGTNENFIAHGTCFCVFMAEGDFTFDYLISAQHLLWPQRRKKTEVSAAWRRAGLELFPSNRRDNSVPSIWGSVASRVWGVLMIKFSFGAALVALLLFAALPQAPAQDARQNEAGQFDFYVLSLSWSPSFCAAAAERDSSRAPTLQCGARPYSFVVHGLWPQYDRGFPEYCQVPAPRLDRAIVSSMLDLMPAPHLVFNEWDKHGTCSGLPPRAYFEVVRKARAVVKIPPEYVDLQEPLSVTPIAVEEAFIKANPELSRISMAIGCDKRRLTEVRICLSRELKFRDCAEIARRSCTRDPLVMPPLRGG
jgi:ribonuclease T2